MRKSHLAFVFTLGVAAAVGVACGDDGQPAPSDSAGSGSDAAGSGTACTNALYDPCTDNAQCTSGNCHMFNMPAPGIKVCTQACDTNNPCPMQNGMAAECGSNSNICRPPAANNCTR